MHGYLAHEMFNYTQQELERQASEQRLVRHAGRARFQNGRAVRVARALHLVSDTGGGVSEPSRDSRTAVRTVR